MNNEVKKKGLSTGQIVALVLSLTLGPIFIIIIILIAVPIMLGIRDGANDEALKRTAELAYDEINNSIASYMVENDGEAPKYVDEIEYYFDLDYITLEVTGVGANSKGKIISSNKKLCDVTAYNGNFTVDCGKYMDEKVIKLHS